MSDLLRELVGREMIIWPRGQPAILQDGGRWIRLISGGPGTLLIPTCTVRLIKVAGGGMTAQSATGGLPPSLLDRTVSVCSSSGAGPFNDTGELEAFDDDWLRVRVKGAQFYFAVSSIVEVRLV